MRALVKLEQVLPAHLRRRVGALGSATIAAPAAGPTVDPQHLTVIAAACRDSECLRFAYRSRDGARHAAARSSPTRSSTWAAAGTSSPGTAAATTGGRSASTGSPGPAPTGVALRAAQAAGEGRRRLRRAEHRRRRRTASRRGSPCTRPRRRSRAASRLLGHDRADRRAHLRVPHRRRRPRLARDADRDARRRLRGARAAGAGRASADLGFTAHARRSLSRGEYVVNCGSVSGLTGHTPRVDAGVGVGSGHGIARRQFLAGGMAAAGTLLFWPAFLRERAGGARGAGQSPYGPLQPPNAAGLMLPKGFTGRQIARGGRPVDGTTYPWHFASDGAAAYSTTAGGHVLVSNSETPSAARRWQLGDSLRPDGAVERAYRDPRRHQPQLRRRSDAMGHMAFLRGARGRNGVGGRPGRRPARRAASRARQLLPRGRGGGPRGRARIPDRGPGRRLLLPLHAGRLPEPLAAACSKSRVVAADKSVTLARGARPEPRHPGKTTRTQVPEATRFDGGEGLWYHEGIIYFTTKGDKKVWAYDARSQTLDDPLRPLARARRALNAVDNVTVSPYGDVYVCEDGGNMEIVPDHAQAARWRRSAGSGPRRLSGHRAPGLRDGRRRFRPERHAHVLQLPARLPVRARHAGGRRRALRGEGPFRLPEGGVPASWVFGPPAGERADGTDYLTDGAPGLLSTRPRRCRSRCPARALP